MVKILRMTIPFLTVVTIIISILAFSKFGFPNISNAEVTGKTLLMPNFIVAFILFAVLPMILPMRALPMQKNALLL